MSGFTYLCPRARSDENGAHDITDTLPAEGSPPLFYCRRCGQAATVAEVLAASKADPDRPEQSA